jgi:hypothetical protein
MPHQAEDCLTITALPALIQERDKACRVEVIAIGGTAKAV